MRLLVHLEILSKNKTLPINYQYPITAWIYKTLHQSDPEFSDWLHQQGYHFEKKKFKLFTFSTLQFEGVQVQGDRITAHGKTCTLKLSFLIPDALGHFVQGCFASQQFSLGDSLSRVDFAVCGIELQPEPDFKETMEFVAITPIVISKPEARNGKLIAQFMKPGDTDYQHFFFNNLMQKYQAAGQTELQNINLQFETKSEAKSRLITIKANTAQATKVKGYLFRFRINAPVALLKTAYLAGFGESNSLGFGMVEVWGDEKTR